MHSDHIRFAWAVGLFEGEGCIVIRQAKNRRFPSCELALSMTDEDVVRRFRMNGRIDNAS